MRNKLTDKVYKQYDRLSRYSAFPYYYNIDDNKYIYGTTANLKNTTTYKAHKCVQGDTYDSLALKYYNNPTYYWIICDYNRINDPYSEIKPGTTLKIPVMSNIEFIV